MDDSSHWTVVADTGPAAFARQAWEYLQVEAVRNNIVCTLAQYRIRRADAGESSSDGAQHWLRVVDRDGAVHGTAVVVPPHGTALLSTMAPRAAQLLAGYFARAAPDLRGADGPEEVAAAFVAGYRTATGAAARTGMAQLLFDLERVAAPQGVAGSPRVAGPDDLALILDWALAFGTEAVPDKPVTEESRRNLAEITRRRLEQRRDAWLWEVDGVPVSYAHRNRLDPVPGLTTVPLVRISAVYTPPEYRGHGYASGNVAALSQLSLDEGAERLLLYTDKANPTSNKIYQEIGYRPVGAAQSWLFTR